MDDDNFTELSDYDDSDMTDDLREQNGEFDKINYQNLLESFEKNHGTRSDYLNIITAILYDNWTSKEDIQTIVSAVKLYWDL